MKRVPLPEQGAGQPNFDPLGPLATQPIVSRARKRPAEPLIAIPRPRRKSKYQKPLGSKFKMRSRRIQSKRTQSKQIQLKQIQFQIGSNPTRRERFVTQDQPRNIFVTKCRKKVICARKLWYARKLCDPQTQPYRRNYTNSETQNPNSSQHKTGNWCVNWYQSEFKAFDYTDVDLKRTYLPPTWS